MLVLTLKIDDEVTFSDGQDELASVVVLSRKGNAIRLGIMAPGLSVQRTPAKIRLKLVDEDDPE